MAGSNRSARVHRRDPAAVRAVARTVVVAGIALIVATGPVAPLWAAGSATPVSAAASPTAAATPPARVKYYVVQRSDHGHPEYLYEIAAKTLGNGNLANEIFLLNKGRPQPGGGRLESPNVIRPGWILVLPPDASGPGVYYGPLPQLSAQGAGDFPMASPPGRRSPAGQPGQPGFAYWLAGLIAVTAALFAVLLTAGLTYLIWRRKRPKRPETPAPESPATVAAALLGTIADKAADDKAAGAFGWFVRKAKPADEPAPQETSRPPQPPDDPAESHWPDWLELDDAPGVPADVPGDPASWPATATVPAAEATADGALPWRRVRPTAGAAPEAVTTVPVHVAARPQAPESPVQETSGEEATYLTMRAEVHQVVLGGDRVRVTLAADEAPDLTPEPVAPGGQSYRHHLTWAPLPYDTPDDGIAFACLGSGDHGCLFLDLGRASSAITMGGDPQAVTRLTESIVHQLCTTSEKPSCSVVVVGDVLPRPLPPGATWLASLDRLGSALTAHPGGMTAIVFCELGAAADAVILSDRVAAARCRVIPVVLNGPLEAPWSLVATPVAEISDAPPD